MIILEGVVLAGPDFCRGHDPRNTPPRKPSYNSPFKVKVNFIIPKMNFMWSKCRLDKNFTIISELADTQEMSVQTKVELHKTFSRKVL